MNKMLLICILMAGFILGVILLMRPVPESAAEDGAHGETSLAGEAPVTDTEIHYHAGFLVYVDGKLQDFSDIRYMKINPCTVEGEEEAHAPEDEQIEKAHLHEEVGDVVHVHRFEAKWKDLFTNVNFAFPPGKTISGYREGTTVENILDAPIGANESVIIVVGNPAGVNLNDYVTPEHIKDVESKSESC
jgi:hypothetical protein